MARVAEDRRERGDEWLAGQRVAVRRLESALLGIRVLAREIVSAWPTRRRKRRASVPRLAGKSRVELNATAPDDDGQEAVDVCQAGFGDDLGDLDSIELACAAGIEPVYAVDDSRVCLGEALRERLGQEQMLCRAGAASLAQHPQDGAVA